LYLGKMYFNHNVRFLIYPIVLTDVKAGIQPVNPTVFMIDPFFLLIFFTDSFQKIYRLYLYSAEIMKIIGKSYESEKSEFSSLHYRFTPHF